MKRDRHFQVAGFDVEEVVALGLSAQGAAADLLDNPHAVVRINHPVAYVENTVTVAAHNEEQPTTREQFYCTGARSWDTTSPTLSPRVFNQLLRCTNNGFRPQLSPCAPRHTCPAGYNPSS